MRWVLTSSPTAALEEYHLLDEDSCKLILKYNPLHRSVRISSGSFQRLFFIESAGVLTGKTIMRNEYGMEVGSVQLDKFSNTDGMVNIEEKKYHYHFQNNSSPELTIYNTNLKSPLISSKLISSFNNISNNFLLMGLCWFLYLPVAKERLVEYAA